MPTADSRRAILVRDAREADMDAVTQIYAAHVLHGLASFEEGPPSLDEMKSQRAAVLQLDLPYLVARPRSTGASSATAMRPPIARGPHIATRWKIRRTSRMASMDVVIGTALLAELIARCERGPWRQMLAVIGDSGNAGSIALHRRLGFVPAGNLVSVGFKLGRWVDSVFMQRALGPGGSMKP